MTGLLGGSGGGRDFFDEKDVSMGLQFITIGLANLLFWGGGDDVYDDSFLLMPLK